MRNPKIIFMGTSYFSVLSIEKILKHKYIVVGVITITDRFSVRNKRIFVESAVKKYSKYHAVPILQSDDLKDSIFLDTLKKWNTEIIIIVSFRILPRVVWELPIFESFNLHPSLLPYYRGAAPIQWAIINGESETGITSFKINKKADMGNIFLQKKIYIKKKENAGSLSIRLSEIGALIAIDTLKIYNCSAPKEQPTNFQLKMAPILLKCKTKINWKSSETIKGIYNNIRGLSPIPGCRFVSTGNLLKKQIKIYRADYKVETHSKIHGHVEKNKIAVNEGYIFILEFQLEGKPPLLIKDLINKKKVLNVIFQ